MKLLLLSLWMMASLTLEAQEATSLFNNKVVMMEGIYTSALEILENSPKYPNVLIEARSSFWIGGYLNIYYFDSAGQKQEFNDSIMFLVYNKMRFVYYKHDFHRLILTGPVSTFMIERVYVEPHTGYRSSETKLFFWDLETGKIDKLTPDRFDGIIKRDSDLYARYNRISKARKRDTLYYYLLQYNERNPTYIYL